MVSDIRKYRGEDAPSQSIVSVLLVSALRGPKDPTSVRRWVEGWN